VNPFEHELHQLVDEGLYRAVRALPAVGGRVEWNGQTYLNFSSNDYLDLARAEPLKAAARAAVDRYGCGATGSRLMTGHLDIHEALEQRLAQWVDMEAALVFGAGFLANVGVITALTGPDDLIFSDQLNHASLIDGCRLSKAASCVYQHNNLDHLHDLLRTRRCSGRRFIVTETLFSMDGDEALTADLRRLADQFDAVLIVDEAHALGVFGPNGSGMARRDGVRPDVLVGTLGKSLGSFGGFVAANQTIIQLLVNRARTFIYSTGLPPASAAAALAAVEVLHAQPELGRALREKAAAFAAHLVAHGIAIAATPSQIVPIVIGANDTALAVGRHLLEDQLLAVAVRPPSVPPGTARLRLSLTLAHDAADLAAAAARIARAVHTAQAPAER
jgi:8-amino-7-oxononanoate synthase